MQKKFVYSFIIASLWLVNSTILIRYGAPHHKLSSKPIRRVFIVRCCGGKSCRGTINSQTSKGSTFRTSIGDTIIRTKVTPQREEITNNPADNSQIADLNLENSLDSHQPTNGVSSPTAPNLFSTLSPVNSNSISTQEIADLKFSSLSLHQPKNILNTNPSLSSAQIITQNQIITSNIASHTTTFTLKISTSINPGVQVPAIAAVLQQTTSISDKITTPQTLIDVSSIQSPAQTVFGNNLLTEPANNQQISTIFASSIKSTISPTIASSAESSTESAINVLPSITTLIMENTPDLTRETLVNSINSTYLTTIPEVTMTLSISTDKFITTPEVTMTSSISPDKLVTTPEVTMTSSISPDKLITTPEVLSTRTTDMLTTTTAPTTTQQISTLTSNASTILTTLTTAASTTTGLQVSTTTRKPMTCSCPIGCLCSSDGLMLQMNGQIEAQALSLIGDWGFVCGILKATNLTKTTKAPQGVTTTTELPLPHFDFGPCCVSCVTLNDTVTGASNNTGGAFVNSRLIADQNNNLELSYDSVGPIKDTSILKVGTYDTTVDKVTYCNENLTITKADGSKIPAAPVINSLEGTKQQFDVTQTSMKGTPKQPLNVPEPPGRMTAPSLHRYKEPDLTPFVNVTTNYVGKVVTATNSTHDFHAGVSSGGHYCDIYIVTPVSCKNIGVYSGIAVSATRSLKVVVNASSLTHWMPFTADAPLPQKAVKLGAYIQASTAIECPYFIGRRLFDNNQYLSGQVSSLSRQLGTGYAETNFNFYNRFELLVWN